MSNVMDALFDQDDEPEKNEVVEDETTQHDGVDEIIDDEPTGDDPDTESEEVDTDATAEESTETKDEDALLTPAEEKIAKAAEGRLMALQIEREKRQNAEREAVEMRKQIAEYQRKEQALRQQNIPDADNDPHGYAQYVQQAAERQILESRFHMSDQMARAKYGAEKVEEAANWATAHIQQNPQLQAVMYAQPDPLNWVVEQFDREQKMTQFVNDPEKLFKEWAEKNGYKPSTETPARVITPAAKPTVKAPPRATAAQITASSNRGGDVPVSIAGILGLK